MSESMPVKQPAPFFGLTVFFLLCLTPPLPTLHAKDLAESKAAQESDDEQLLADLKEAWQARTRRFNSVKFAWDEEREYHIGSIIPGPFAKAHNIDNVHPVLGFPIETTTTKLPREIVLQGNWMRHVSRSIGPSQDGSSLRQEYYLAVYDGTSSRKMSKDGKSIQGSIRDEDKNTDSGSASFIGLNCFIRPFHPQHGMVKPDALKIVRRNQDDGTIVVEANHLKRFVVDPRRDFIVVSWEIGNPINGGNLYQGKTEYKQDELLGWVPSKWESERYDVNIPSLLMEKYKAELAQIEAGKEYDRSLFRIEFPVGSRVWNAYIRKEFVVKDPDDPRITYDTP